MKEHSVTETTEVESQIQAWTFIISVISHSQKSS